MLFLNRREAGKKLATKLSQYKSDKLVVVALPRGGVVLGHEVSKDLNAPLGTILVKKIVHPRFPEFAIGAVAEDEQPIYDDAALAYAENSWLKHAEADARKLIDHRKSMYFGRNNKRPDLEGKNIVVVDDGIATGLTMKAAILALKTHHPKHLIIAVPVASTESIAMLSGLVDEIIVLDDPSQFMSSVGSHYVEFDQVSDEEVQALLHEANNDSQPNNYQAHRKTLII